MADPTDPGFDPEAIFKDAQKRFLESDDNLRKGLDEEKGLFARLMGLVLDFFGAAFTKVWTGFDARFGSTIRKLGDTLRLGFMHQPDKDIDDAFGMFERLGMFTAEDTEMLKSVLKGFRFKGQLFAPVMQLTLWASIISALGDTMGGTAMQNLNKKFSPSVPNPQEIARTSFVAPELHDRVVDAMKRSGLSKEDIELIYVSLYTMQNPGEIMQLFWRGELDTSQAINRMQELGYTDTRVAELMKLWDRIPSMPDVVRYLGKEAFEPAMIRQFELLGDYPREATEKWAAANGYSKEWAEKEWIAHWRDVGVAPVLEGLHRHTKVKGYGEVDAKYVDDYLRLIEIPGPIREIIAKTSYNPYTRVDARRMHDMGVLKDEDLVRVYEAQGYDEAHAENMALFTIRYNNREGKTFTRSDVEKAYEDGDISFDQAGVYLVEAGYTVDYAAFILKRVDIEKERAKRLDATEIIKARYLSNLIEKDEARNQLLGIGFGNPRVAELLDRWTAIRITNAKLPSKTDLDKMLKHGIVTESIYKMEMKKLGYNEEYISWYLDLAKSGAEG